VALITSILYVCQSSNAKARTCSDDGYTSTTSPRPHALTLPCWASSAAASSAADLLLTDTTPYGLMALKGALAAAGSAQSGELRRSQERHQRQGCRGRARCDGAGSRRPRAAPRRDCAQPSPRRLRIWPVHEMQRDRATAGGHVRP
jgi:hypothetical protein